MVIRSSRLSKVTGQEAIVHFIEYLVCARSIQIQSVTWLRYYMDLTFIYKV